MSKYIASVCAIVEWLPPHTLSLVKELTCSLEVHNTCLSPNLQKPKSA